MMVGTMKKCGFTTRPLELTTRKRMGLPTVLGLSICRGVYPDIPLKCYDNGTINNESWDV
jgi:hypothetical protein